MEIFLGFLLIGILVVLYEKINNLKTQVEALKDRLKIFESMISNQNATSKKISTSLPQKQPNETSEAQPKFETISKPELIAKPIQAPPQSIAKIEQAKSSDATKPTAKIEPKPIPKKEKSLLWIKAEDQLMENWAGVLGGIILIIGIGFFGTYAYIYFSSIIRSILILTVSIGFFGLSLWFQKKKGWDLFSALLQSISGAIFLFTSLASGYIDGIQWIENDSIAFVVLFIGILVNLGIGYHKNKEIFGSLHFTLSLAALVTVPSGNLSLIAGTSIAIVVIIKNYFSKWNYHLLTVSILYFIFHLYELNTGVILKENSFDKISGILCIVVFYGIAHSIHYNVNFYKENKGIISILTNILNICFAGILLLQYSTGEKYATIFIAIAAISLFYSSYYARKKEIRWLFISDLWTAEFITLIFIYSLNKWNVPISYIFGLCALEITLFHLWNLRNENGIFRKASLILQQVSSLIFILMCIFSEEIALKLMGIGFIAFYIGILHLINFSEKFHKENKFYSIATYIYHVFLGSILSFQYIFIEKYASLGIALVAILFFICSYISKRKNIDWLWKADFWAFQYISLVTILSLNSWNLPVSYILLLTSIETMLFHIWNTKPKYQIFVSFSSILQFGFSLIFLLYSFITRDNKLDWNANLNSALHVIYLICYFLFYIKSNSIYNKVIFKQNPAISTMINNWNGVLMPLGLIQLYLTYQNSIYSDWIISVVICVLLYLRSKKQLNSLAIGLAIIISIIQISFWLYAYQLQNIDLILYIKAIPFLIIYGFSIYFSNYEKLKLNLKFPGIYALTIHICFILYISFLSISTLIFGILCLIFSLVTLEAGFFLKNRTEKKEIPGNPDFHLHFLSYGFLLLFLQQHIFVHLQSETIFILPLVSWIQIFASLVLFYHLFFNEIEIDVIFKKIRPFFAESILVLLILIFYKTVPDSWLPVAWSFFTIPVYFTSRWEKIQLLHFRSYAILIYLINCALIAFLSSSKDPEGISLLNQKWIPVIFAFIVQLLSLLIIFKNFNSKSKIDSLSWPKLARIENFFLQLKSAILFYPLYISAFLFLYWYFSGGYLTLLWTTLAFSIFIVSLIFKENHFRYVSSTIIILCIIRLIFFDLAREGTIIKAFVFLGIGIILLIMNYLYKRFRIGDLK